MENLLLEIKWCFVSLEITDELPRNVCAADLVHLIDDALKQLEKRPK